MLISPQPSTFVVFLGPDGQLLDQGEVPAALLQEALQHTHLYLSQPQGTVTLSGQVWQFSVEPTLSHNRWVRLHPQDQGMSLRHLPLSQAMDSSPIGIAIVSPAGRWLRVNPVICQMLGYTQEELLRCDFQSLTHPDDLEDDLGFVEKALQRELQCFVFNKRYVRKDGKVIWARLSSTLIWKDEHTPAFFYSHLEDITEQQALQQDLSHSLAYQQALIDVFQLLNEGDLTPMEVARRVVKRIGEAAGLDWSCLAVQHGDDMHIEPMHRKEGLTGFLAQDQYPPVPRTTSLVWEAADTGKANYVDDIRDHPRALKTFIDAGIVAVAVVPIHRVLDGKKLVFSANRLEGRPWSEQDRNLFETALLAVDISMERRQSMHLLQQAALMDALTNLGNRRAFEQDFRSEHARAKRHNQCLGLMVLDLDGLKTVNDRMGHEAGDRLLQCFAQHLKDTMRVEDRCYRLGGDEFAVILSHCPVESSVVLHRRIEKMMDQVRLEGFEDSDVSVGFAFFPEERFSVEDLLRLADERMYLMKAQHHLEE